MTDSLDILIIGAGELGQAIIEALLAHPVYAGRQQEGTISLSLLVRPATLANPSPDKAARFDDYRSRGIHLVSGDVEEDSSQRLTTLLKPFTSVIHAGGLMSNPGTQLRLTRAVLDAKVAEYVPWQFGVDYDIITRSGGQGLFTEQLDVRDLLRSASNTSTTWFIVGCGIFTTLLFEDMWGAVERGADGHIHTVRALGGWDHLLTTTTDTDIGRCTAELMLVDRHQREKTVYIAGDSMPYTQFANVVETAVGTKIKRELWETDWLRRQVAEDSSDKIRKYRLVFSEDRGLAWPVDHTYNADKGIPMQGIADWLSKTSPAKA